MSPTFTQNGACQGKPTEWFFPELPRRRNQIANNRVAIGLCRECSVQLECLRYALEWESHGIWGGTYPHQREEMRKERGIQLRNRGFDHFAKSTRVG